MEMRWAWAKLSRCVESREDDDRYVCCQQVSVGGVIFHVQHRQDPFGSDVQPRIGVSISWSAPRQQRDATSADSVSSDSPLSLDGRATHLGSSAESDIVASLRPSIQRCQRQPRCVCVMQVVRNPAVVLLHLPSLTVK